MLQPAKADSNDALWPTSFRAGGVGASCLLSRLQHYACVRKQVQVLYNFLRESGQIVIPRNFPDATSDGFCFFRRARVNHDFQFRKIAWTFF
jgi:hypothetical protein